MSVLSIGILIHFTAYSQSYNSQDGKIYAAGYGAHNSTTLQTLITRIGVNKAYLVINGGSWSITNDLTFPTNIAVEVFADSLLNVSTGKTVAINGAFYASGYPIHAGTGIINGDAKFLYRWPQWGSTNKVIFTSAGISGTDWPLTTVLSNGNNADNQSATNFSDIQSITGRFGVVTVSGALTAGSLSTTGSLSAGSFIGNFVSVSNDMAVSFMGYPLLDTTAFASNLVNAVDTGTAMQTNQFHLILDNSLATFGTNIFDHGYQTFTLDLGADYVGYVTAVIGRTNGTTGSTYIGLGGTPTATNAITDLISAGIAIGGSVVCGSDGVMMATPSVTGKKLQIVKPFSGRAIQLITADGGAGTDGSIQFYMLKVYAITNSYRNFGGAL